MTSLAPYATGTYAYKPTTILDALNSRGVGFSDHFRFLEEVLSATSQAKFPPYDIVQINDDEYQIRFAVAGFKRDDIKITIQDQILTVKGEQESSSESFMHKGIATRDFLQRFPLAEYIEVKSAKMEDGILTVNLFRNIPDELKPQTIEIE